MKYKIRKEMKMEAPSKEALREVLTEGWEIVEEDEPEED